MRRRLGVVAVLVGTAGLLMGPALADEGDPPVPGNPVFEIPDQVANQLGVLVEDIANTWLPWLKKIGDKI